MKGEAGNEANCTALFTVNVVKPSTDIEEGVDKEEVKEGERRRLPGSRKRSGRWKTLGRSRAVEAYSGFLHVS